MSQSKLHPEYLRQKALQEALLARKNHKSDWYNGIYDRWDYPVLTREHIPLEWRFDLDPASNPYFMERLGVNAVFNAGAIELDGKFYLVARVDCFRDQALAAANVGSSLLMTKGGNRWYDSMGMSWVSPVNTQVRQYLVDLCVELSQMGFDELVLDSAYFPDQGEVHVLAQSTNYPDTRTTVVEQFWQEVTQALEGSEVRLSAQVRGDSLVEGGVALQGIESRGANLEDYFLSMIGGVRHA